VNRCNQQKYYFDNAHDKNLGMQERNILVISNTTQHVLTSVNNALLQGMIKKRFYLC
jgi:hypothetical protein